MNKWELQYYVSSRMPQLPPEHFVPLLTSRMNNTGNSSKGMLGSKIIFAIECLLFLKPGELHVSHITPDNFHYTLVFHTLQQMTPEVPRDLL